MTLGAAFAKAFATFATCEDISIVSIHRSCERRLERVQEHANDWENKDGKCAREWTKKETGTGQRERERHCLDDVRMMPVSDEVIHM